jgi:PAS domain S-box-containing protein
MNTVLLHKNFSENSAIALILVFMGMFSLMAVFELIVQLFLTGIGVWLTIFVTILASGISAVFISFFPLRALREAEAAAGKSEAQLNSIIHGLPVLQFVIDTSHRVISWNRVLEQYSGVKEQDVVGTAQQWKGFYSRERPCLADLLVDGAIEKLPEWYEGKIRKSKLVEGGYEAVDFFPEMLKGGTYLFFTATPVRDQQGTLIGAVETLVDISDLKRAEAEVKTSHERYLSYFKEAAMRLKTPVEVVSDNLSVLVSEIGEGDVNRDHVVPPLMLQIKNLDQIRHNIIHLNKTIVESFGDVPAASKKFLTE